MFLETMAERNKDCNKEMKVKNKEREEINVRVQHTNVP